MPQTVLTLIASLWLLLACPATLQAQAAEVDSRLSLASEVEAKAFAGVISAHRDAQAALTVQAALALQADGGFAPVQSHAPNFGFTPEPIWLYLPLDNPTDIEDWRLRLRENFFQEFSAWHIPEGGVPQLLEDQNETTGFGTRAVQWSELVVGFRQPPGSKGALIIRYRSGGSSEVEFTAFSADRFNTWAAEKTARHFLFYGMLILLTLAALAVWLATQQPVFLAYAVYAASGLMFVMHGDGNTFRYLWPDAPGFNAFATVPLGVSIIVFGANFARQFLQTSLYHPVFDKLLWGTIGLTIAVGASSAFLDTQMIKKVLVLMAFASVLLFTASGLNAARTRLREVRFFVLAWFGAVVSASIMTGRHWLGIEISEEVQFNSMRVVFVLDAALMGFAIIDRINAIRKSRADALNASLAQAQQNLALSRRMQTLEQRYTIASDLAQTREQQVADAIHDLRQPLHALRLAVQDMLSGSDTGRKPQRQEIEESFRFLEGLVADELAAHMGPPAPKARSDDDAVALDEVFAAVCAMFENDARAKGLTLTVVPTQAILRLPAIAVMRILTNLVSNALRYTPAGEVRLEATPEGDSLSIAVHDTGPGLSDAQFAAALERGVRLVEAGAAEGSGLGLAIVSRTCGDCGLTLGLLPSRLGGTSLGVTVGPDFLT